MTETGAGGRTSLHGQWSGRLAFILAVTGSAVGLGNIWRFPYIAGENGGGAFVIAYLVCIVIVGLPIMMAEVLIGRRGRRNPVATMRLLGEEESGSGNWKLVGAAGVGTGFLILSFYSVIAGWALAYVFESASNAFAGATRETVEETFNSLASNPLRTGLWHTIFLAATAFVIARGVERGIERAVRLMMPALVLLLLVLLGYSAVEGDFAQGLRFMFEPRFDELTRDGLMEALGHAFFTLSVGMGAVMAYGAYLPSDTSIMKMSVAVVAADTAIALIAALVVFPIVFANGLDPEQGPGLVFVSLPLAFGQMPGGAVIAILLFLLLTFAAWTSAISLMEPATAWIIEKFGFRRAPAATLMAGVTWLISLLTILSFSTLSGMTFLRGTFFDNIDFLSNSILLPIGGLAIVIFVGWIMARSSTAGELDPEAGTAYRVWRFTARYLTPLAIVAVLLRGIGVI